MHTTSGTFETLEVFCWSSLCLRTDQLIYSRQHQERGKQVWW